MTETSHNSEYMPLKRHIFAGRYGGYLLAVRHLFLEVFMYKVGTRVNTPNGAGTIIDHEIWDGGNSRYVITLDNNPFSYSKVCYFFKEVTKINDPTTAYTQN